MLIEVEAPKQRSGALVVNLIAGPGAGKSTLASYVFSKLKFAGVNSELAPEFAKELTWEGRFSTLANQVYVFGKQLHRILRVCDQVDVIVCDSPLVLSSYYNRGERELFDPLVLKLFNSFRNVNYFVERRKPYNPAGRNQTEDEAKNIDKKLLAFLEKNDVEYDVIPGTIEGGEVIVKDVLKILGRTN